MASAYSKPRDFGKYIKPVNTELVNFVLQSKQQKFDYNLAKVESTLAEFGDLGLIRDQDKEYLVNRIQSITEGMGDIENMDWSDGGVVRQIQSGIKGAIDERVVNDIKMSKQYTSYMDEVQRVKEEEPEKYSDVNFYMGLKNSGALQWSQGQAASFSDLSYSPYIDVRKNKNEQVKDFIKTHGDERLIETQGVNGEIIQTTIKGLSEEQVTALYNANLTVEERRQLQMEADYMIGNHSEEDKAMFMKTYQEKIRTEAKDYIERAEELENSAAKTSDANKKQEYLTAAKDLKEKAEFIKTEGQKLGFEEAYRDDYTKTIREDVVRANSFERVTDIERDLSNLKAIKLQAEIIAKTQENAETTAEENGANLAIRADGGLSVEENTSVFATQAIEDMSTASENMTNVLSKEATSNPQAFKDTYGIEASAYNKKTKEEKEKFASKVFGDIESEGVDINANGYSPEAMKAYQEYAASATAFNNVNKGIKESSDVIAKKSFDAMSKGIKEGGFSIQNFRNPVIREIMSKYDDYSKLSKDEEYAFRVAMIDESLREGYIKDEIKPYILQNREELIESIEDKNLKNKFRDSNIVSQGTASNMLESAFNYVKTGLSAHPLAAIFADDYLGNIKSNYQDAKEAGDEVMDRGVTPFDLFVSDQDFGEVGDRWGSEADFIVDGEGMSASTFISSHYDSAVEEAHREAGETAGRYASTYVISVSPLIKAEKDIATRGIQAIVLNNPDLSTDDFGKDDVEIRYDKKNNALIYSANIKTGTSNFYDKSERRMNSKPIPLHEEAKVIPSIANRIKTDEDSWALDTRNKAAKPLKFRTSGFTTDNDRIEAIKNMPKGKLSEEALLQIEQNRTNLGYTSNQLERKFKNTVNADNKRFVEEFPKTYQRLVQNEGEFVMNYESKHNQGYFLTIDYKIGDKTVNLVPPTFQGRKLDYEQEYLKTFENQKNVIDYIQKAFQLEDDEFLAKLQEIEQL